jgi:hypothetical protein
MDRPVRGGLARVAVHDDRLLPPDAAVEFALAHRLFHDAPRVWAFVLRLTDHSHRRPGLDDVEERGEQDAHCDRRNHDHLPEVCRREEGIHRFLPGFECTFHHSSPKGC